MKRIVLRAQEVGQGLAEMHDHEECEARAPVVRSDIHVVLLRHTGQHLVLRQAQVPHIRLHHIEDPGVEGWSGPYLPPNTEVPVVDGWQNPITYRRQRSQMSGNLFGDLISSGPNGIFSQGQTDDLRVLITLTSELQAAVQANLAP